MADEVSIVDRIARALRPELWGGPEAYPETVFNDETLAKARRATEARASVIIEEVLRTLRGPTAEMSEAGAAVIRGRYGHSFEPDAIWQAMVDEALRASSAGGFHDQ